MEKTPKLQHEQLYTQIKEFIGVYRDAAAKLSISENEFWVWQTLIREPGEHTQQSLCNLLTLPKQTVNAIITHMILKKYVRLEKIPRQRVKIIRLTDEGKLYGETLIHSTCLAENRAIEQIPAEEFAAMINSLQKYIGIIRYELDHAT